MTLSQADSRAAAESIQNQMLFIQSFALAGVVQAQSIALVAQSGHALWSNCGQKLAPRHAFDIYTGGILSNCRECIGTPQQD